MFDFKYDIDDYNNIPGLFRPWDNGEPFLAPVFFDKSVLVQFLFNPLYDIIFYSETYGSISFNDEWELPFGINTNNKVIVWLGDLHKIPEKEQQYFLSKNISSDHNIKSEFYDAQINVKFTKPIFEVSAVLQKSKINDIVREKYKTYLFKDNISDTNGLFKELSKFKKIIIGDIDNFKRGVVELDKIIIDDIDIKELKRFLDSQSISVSTEIKSIKVLELFTKEFLGCGENMVLPYFVLRDLRDWASHRGLDDKYKLALKRLDIKQVDNKNYSLIYEKLLLSIIDFHKSLIKII